MTPQEFTESFRSGVERLKLTEAEKAQLFSASVPTMKRWLEGCSVPTPGMRLAVMHSLERALVSQDYPITDEQAAEAIDGLKVNADQRLNDTCSSCGLNRSFHMAGNKEGQVRHIFVPLIPAGGEQIICPIICPETGLHWDYCPEPGCYVHNTYDVDINIVPHDGPHRFHCSDSGCVLDRHHEFDHRSDSGATWSHNTSCQAGLHDGEGHLRLCDLPSGHSGNHVDKYRERSWRV